MNPKVHYIPAGYHTATPYLIVQDAARAIEFYKKAFGASEVLRMPTPEGKVADAEIQIGDSRVMMADESPQCGARSPSSYGGTPVSMCLYVKDCDAVLAKAMELGAKSLRAVQDQFYGDRSGTIVDPFGHQWTIATHQEDVSDEEMRKRAAAMFGKK